MKGGSRAGTSTAGSHSPIVQGTGRRAVDGRNQRRGLASVWPAPVGVLLLIALLASVLAACAEPDDRRGKEAGSRAQRVFDRAMQSMGGLQALAQAKTLVFHGREFRPKTFGPEAHLWREIYVQRPGRYKEILDDPGDEMEPVVTVWNQDHGWASDLYGRTRPAPKTRIAFDRWKNTDLLSLHRALAQGTVTMEYSGRARLEGEPVDVLRFRWGRQWVSTEYAFCRKDGTLLRVRSPMGRDATLGDSYAEIWFGDYRNVSGELRFPFRVEYRQVDDLSTIVQGVVRFEQIRVNVTLSDNLFDPPAPGPAGPQAETAEEN